MWKLKSRKITDGDEEFTIINNKEFTNDLFEPIINWITWQLQCVVHHIFITI